MAKAGKGPLVVLVVSQKKYDDCAKVHATLDAIHEKSGISIIAHVGRGAGAFASAWARIPRKQLVSEFISRAPDTRTAVKAVLASNVDLIVAFDPMSEKAVRKLAKNTGAAVLSKVS